MYVVQGENELIVKLLLKYDADVNTKNAYGDTALMGVTQGEYHAIIKLLKDAGATE